LKNQLRAANFIYSGPESGTKGQGLRYDKNGDRNNPLSILIGQKDGIYTIAILKHN
jgi:hypothetical protein